MNWSIDELITSWNDHKMNWSLDGLITRRIDQ